MKPQSQLIELALIFLKLGCISFGGPAAHIAMMQNEFVLKRKWLTEEEFIELIGLVNIIPGPNSTEMAIHIGFKRARWPGFFIAGLAFIFPAALIVSGIAWAYLKFGKLPGFIGPLEWMKPVVLAIIVQAIWSLGSKVLKTKTLIALFFGCLAFSLFIGNELLLLLCAGIIMGILHLPNSKKSSIKKSTTFFMLFNPKILISFFGLKTLGSLAKFEKDSVIAGIGRFKSIGGLTDTTALSIVLSEGLPIALSRLFLVFLKIGSLIFGSGYVLIAFLRSELVEHLHWITESQLLDAVLVGQFTPGPVFTTATFIGIILAGPLGGLIATVAIFLPVFIFVAITGPILSLLRRSVFASGFLSGVNIASLALMASVSLKLGQSALVHSSSFAIFALSSFFMIRYKMNSLIFLFIAAVIGFFIFKID